MSRSPQIVNAFTPHVVAPPSNWQPAHVNARSRFSPIFAGLQIVLLTRKRTFSHKRTSLADGSLGARSRPLPQRYVTMPVRSVRYRTRGGLYECSTLGDKI